MHEHLKFQLGALRGQNRRVQILTASGKKLLDALGGVAARAFKALAEKGINIRAITTSEIKFSMLIDDAYTELAVRTLHTLYGLDQV